MSSANDNDDLPPGILRSAPIKDLSPPAPLSCEAREGGVDAGDEMDVGTSTRPLAPPSLASQERGAGGERSTLTAIEPQERHKDRVNLFVDGRFVLGVFADVAASLGLKVGQRITSERLEEIARAETRRKAKEAAYHLLSFRARSEKEIADRLRRKGYEEDVIAEVTESLRGQGFVNDEVFAASWVESRGRTRGRRALAFELQRKGVAAETTRQALEEAKDSDAERASARAAAVRKVGERPTDRSREARARLAAFLQRRGFDWETIRPVLNELYTVDIEAETDEGSEET